MPSRTFQTWQREAVSHRLPHAASGHQVSFEKLLGIKNCVCVCVPHKKKKPTCYFFTLCLKRHGLWAVQEDRVRLYCILMPAHVSIPLPSSVSQMLPTGRAQMQRQIGDLRERTGHWTGVTLSLNVSKCLPSLLLLILSSEESPNISEASLMEFFAIAAIFLSICSPPPTENLRILLLNETELNYSQLFKMAPIVVRLPDRSMCHLFPCPCSLCI